MRRFIEPLLIVGFVCLVLVIGCQIEKARRLAGAADRECPICGCRLPAKGSFRCDKGIHTPVGNNPQ